MKHYKEEQYTSTRKVLVREECDKCGKDIDYKELSSYDVNDFDMEWEVGHRYPCCDFVGERTILELCIPCRSELFKLLVENGYTLQVKECD